MRLADFILSDREAIMVEWEAFARTCAPASGVMGIAALRDHASEMLTVIAKDLATPQGERARVAKSHGKSDGSDGEAPTAAEAHGAGRAESGFTVEQMVSEYRALRASVIRLWSKAKGSAELTDLEDLTRFNEAIDQAIAESVTRYTTDLDQSREMFLAILGHDLRTPLGAITTSAQFMLETGELKEPNLTLTSRVASSSVRMVHMVGALLDFTRSRLGGGIPVDRAPIDLQKVVCDVVEEARAAYPDRTITLVEATDLEGEWDAARISQALTNLIGNAIEHGSAGTEVTVTTRSAEHAVHLAVHNRGPAIPPEQAEGIFEPMKGRWTSAKPMVSAPQGNLGLGLYIAERIVHAHQGTIDVQSSEAEGTTFSVHLPRHGGA